MKDDIRREALKRGPEPSPERKLPPLSDLVREHFALQPDRRPKASDLISDFFAVEPGRKAVSEREQILSSAYLAELASEAAIARALIRERKAVIAREAETILGTRGEAHKEPIICPTTYTREMLKKAGVEDAIVARRKDEDGSELILVGHPEGVGRIRTGSDVFEQDLRRFMESLGLEIPQKDTVVRREDLEKRHIEYVGEALYGGSSMSGRTPVRQFTYAYGKYYNTFNIPSCRDGKGTLDSIDRHIIKLHTLQGDPYLSSHLEAIASDRAGVRYLDDLGADARKVARTIDYLSATLLCEEGYRGFVAPIDIREDLIPMEYRKAVEAISWIPLQRPVELSEQEEERLADAFRDIGEGSARLCDIALKNLGRAFDALREPGEPIPDGIEPFERKMAFQSPDFIERNRAAIVGFITSGIDSMRAEGILI